VTYHDAFAQARRACSQSKQVIHVLHAPQYSDAPSESCYEYANQSARAMLMPLASVVVTIRPVAGGVDVFPAPAPLPRA
jgi:hypothetical protein